MIRVKPDDISDNIIVCPYCMSEVEEHDYRGCCGESSAHFVKAYIVSGHDDIVLEDEIIIEE